MSESVRHPWRRLGALWTPPPAAVQPLVARTALDQMRPFPADWFKALPASGDALGNDIYSDCWPVARRMVIALRRANVAGEVLYPTLQACLSDYTLLTGFNQLSPANTDNGTDVVAGMKEWCRVGVQINDQTLDIPHWLKVDPTNDAHLALAIGCAGPLMATWKLPVALQDLSAWSQAPGTGSDWTTLWGYHATVFGATDGGDGVTTRTWGVDLEVHPDIRRQFCIGVDVPLDLEPGGWTDPATGITPLAGLDRVALAADMQKLTA